MMNIKIEDDHYVSTPNTDSPTWKALKKADTIHANFISVNLKQPIGDIFIDGRKFDPQPDMSPIEASWIAILMSYITMRGWNNWDFEPFIHEHKLDRHFMPKDG